ncbi:MAG: hypothetical protein ABC596_09630 [Candidatus Methanosuratincola petrocarbonis]
MIHPQYWSLYSVYQRLRYGGESLLTPEDRKWYATLPLKDAVVLDVGAYNGDSAKFFLEHGAKQVICIEPDVEQALKIEDPRCRIIIDEFRLEHLRIPHDCIKVDIEGWEEILLDYDKPLKPCVVEVHGQQLWKKFEDRGWEYVSKSRLANCTTLMRNFKPGAVRA